MESIFNVNFYPPDLDMNELEEALKQIDEARATILKEISDWKKERARELTHKLNSLIRQIGNEGYNLHWGDEVYMAYELRDEDYAPAPTVTVAE